MIMNLSRKQYHQCITVFKFKNEPKIFFWQILNNNNASSIQNPSLGHNGNYSRLELWVSKRLRNRPPVFHLSEMFFSFFAPHLFLLTIFAQRSLLFMLVKKKVFRFFEHHVQMDDTYTKPLAEDCFILFQKLGIQNSIKVQTKENPISFLKLIWGSKKQRHSKSLKIVF
jgi:hypothetical protein